MVDQKRLTISQVAEITGYKPHVIRFYEKEFNLEIPRNKSGHRYFTYKELETLQYIKQLQEKGLTNNQIKQILSTPEVMVQGDDRNREVAVTQPTAVQWDLSQYKLQEYLGGMKDEIKEELCSLSQNVKELSTEIRAKDKDILICENAKLKMDVKRKAYEVAELREQLKREKNKNRSVFSKLFGK